MFSVLVDLPPLNVRNHSSENDMVRNHDSPRMRTFRKKNAPVALPIHLHQESDLVIGDQCSLASDGPVRRDEGETELCFLFGKFPVLVQDIRRIVVVVEDFCVLGKNGTSSAISQFCAV